MTETTPAPPVTPKTVYEHLCLAQGALGQWARDGHDPDRAHQAAALLGHMIEQVEWHRPLGVNGKHGDHHTDTCGCDDHQGTWSIEFPGPDAADELRRVAAAPGVLWMAARYAYGRATYAVAEVCDAIDAHLDLIRPAQAARMANEITREAVPGGWQCDSDRWAATATRLRQHAGPDHAGIVHRAEDGWTSDSARPIETTCCEQSSRALGSGHSLAWRDDLVTCAGSPTGAAS